MTGSKLASEHVPFREIASQASSLARNDELGAFYEVVFLPYCCEQQNGASLSADLSP